MAHQRSGQKACESRLSANEQPPDIFFVTASVRKLAPTEVELDIEVSANDFAQAQERAFRKLATRYRMPGFRPGRVPRRIFEQHVGKESIEHQAIEDLVPEAYAKALKEHQLEPVDRPHFDLDRSAEDKSLRIKAKVAVRPDIALGNYRGLAVTRPPATVNETEVDHSIQALRKRAATLEPVEDRGIERDDIVTMDYVGRIDGEPFEGGSAQNHTTEVSDERLLPGFAEQLAGARPAEQRNVTVTFPPTYRVAELAGKTAIFDVTIHEIKRALLPELDDAFAVQVSDHKTLADLRADVRRRLEAVAAARSREAMQKQILDALVAESEFPLPDVMVKREIESLITDAKTHVQRLGRSWEEYLTAKGVDESGLQAEYKEEAERRVKTALLLEEIAKRETIEVTTAELERELDSLAASYGQSREAMIELLRKSTGFGPIIDTVRKGKTLDFLLEQATVSDEKPAEKSEET